MVNEVYNLTNTSGGFLNLVTGTNDALNSVPMFGLLVALYLVLFIGMSRSGTARAFAVSNTITSIVGILFTLAGLISATWLGIFIILLAITGGSVIIYNKNQGGI